MSKNSSLGATDLFLGVLAILLISVSFYQTWLGLEQIFGNASFVIALVLSLLLLFLCWMLRAAKLEGKPTGSLVGIYIFIASFCFIANFNALYTRFMRTDIYTEELRLIDKKLNDLETDVESKLNYTVANSKTRQEIRSELNLLKTQITSPSNPGIGTEAKQIISRIEKLLGRKLTPLTQVSNNASGYSDLAGRMEEQVVEMVYNLSPEEKNLMTDINNAVLKWDKEIPAILALPNNQINDIAQGKIDQSLNEYNKLGGKASSILGNEKLKFEPATTDTQEIGKLGYAFRHAISNFGFSQFMVLAGCILLDFVIVIIILLVTSPDNNKQKGIGPNRRGGRTLINKN
ncbi:hypothetical protein [Chryseobacterium sp.]|uniref:hypothetical protein n=1 Tax=Chryseobacterium sp. TaxID=1871047 RepID=UPI002FC97E05